MTDLDGLDQRFWRLVWQCDHRHPCQRCCWPWAAVDTTVNTRTLWHWHPLWRDAALPCILPGLHRRQQLPVARIAYLLFRRQGIFSGYGFVLMHVCHFGPCCNYSHLLPGSVADNNHAHSGYARSRDGGRHPISLPDGRVFSYPDAISKNREEEEIGCNALVL